MCELVLAVGCCRGRARRQTQGIITGVSNGSTRTCKIEWRWHETEKKDDKCQQRCPASFRIESGRIVDGGDAQKAHAEEQRSPDIPSLPPETKEPKKDQKNGKNERRSAMQPWIQGTQDVAAVELSDGQEIQRSGE